MKRTAIIMAGGSGERFWPVSRKIKPKQLLNLTSEKTMLEESIERISPVIPPEDIYIITGRALLEPIRRTIPSLPPENVVAEPYKRNTAPCLALGAAFITSKYAPGCSPSEISIAVLTADQMIEPREGFTKTIEATLSYVEQHDVLAAIGIPPSRPETGYGYVEIEEPFDYSSGEPEIKPVLSFREKPALKKAEEYVESGKFLWNSGMFFWRADVFTENMKKHLPEVGNEIEKISRMYEKHTNKALPDAFERTAPVFEKFPNESIDFGLMEKASRVVVSKALFSWDDIGSWDSLERVRKKNELGNITEGTAALVDCRDSIIVNNTGKKIAVAGLGLENMVIVATEDAFLVCPKDRVQEVKKCVSKLREQGGEKWL